LSAAPLTPFWLIGYARVSKADGSLSLDLQYDALASAGVEAANCYSDRASGKNDVRLGLEACVNALQMGDILVIWKLDQLGRSLHHLVNTVNDLSERGVGLKVLTGTGAQIDTTTPAGRLSFGVFAALADFESDLIRERTMAGLAAARTSGRKDRRKFALSKTQVCMAQVAMANRNTSVSELCKDLGIKPVTLYRYIYPSGELRDYKKRVLNPWRRI
jgi:DNA invertase Pin-like site-specific DNA recombinase